VDDIKMDLREIGCGSKDRIYWILDRDQWMALVNTVLKLRVPAFERLSGCTCGGLSTRAQLHGIS
jgi:hypothetical protein